MKRRKVLLGLLFVLPALAQAQSHTAIVTASGADVCTNGTSQRLFAEGSVATSCVSADGRVSMSGSSSNFAGVLRSQTAMSVAGGPIAQNVRMGAQASWYDFLRYSTAAGSPLVRRVDLHFLFSGILSSDGVVAGSIFQGYSPSGGVYVSKTTNGAGGSVNGGQIPYQSFADDLVWGLNVSNGSAFLEAALYTDLQGGPKAQAISGYSDFSHTVGLTGISFFDANNNDISADVTYSFDNGLQFLPTNVVPEPGTWAMMVCGLACVGLVTKRRVRR